MSRGHAFDGFRSSLDRRADTGQEACGLPAQCERIWLLDRTAGTCRGPVLLVRHAVHLRSIHGLCRFVALAPSRRQGQLARRGICCRDHLVRVRPLGRLSSLGAGERDGERRFVAVEVRQARGRRCEIKGAITVVPHDVGGPGARVRQGDVRRGLLTSVGAGRRRRRDRCLTGCQGRNGGVCWRCLRARNEQQNGDACGR